MHLQPAKTLLFFYARELLLQEKNISKALMNQFLEDADQYIKELSSSIDRFNRSNKKNEIMDALLKFHQSRMEQFLKDVNKDIQQLNELIENFNQSNEKNEKIGSLLKIHDYRKKILNTYSERQINERADFQKKIQIDLFTDIKKQAELLGIASIDKKTPELAVASTAPETLPEIIENMDQEKAEKLLSKLSAGNKLNKQSLINLYQAGEAGYNEYKKFWRTHDITYLGGSNSKNFKITPSDGSTPYILKVEYRMNAPKSAEVYLRAHSLKEVLTKDKADRLATFYDSTSGYFTTRRLVVTEFCTGGDLLAHREKISDDQEKIQSALKIYTQMGAILNGIKDDGFGFPDMKNTNWLIDESGEVRIADSKSFMYANSIGQIERGIDKNFYFSFISSEYMNPPEFKQNDPVDIDRMHSFMLGKNLYEYLTGCSYTKLSQQSSAADYDFSDPVFKDDIGQMLKETICRMIQPEPYERISVDTALQELKTATEISRSEIQNCKRECLNLLQRIKKTKLGDGDQKRDDYILEKTKDSANFNVALKTELEETIKQIEILEQITEKLKGTWGGTAKIQRIERAFWAIPVEDRKNLSTADTGEKLELHNALASHRHFWRSEPKMKKMDREKIIDENTAARSFVFFKQEMGKINPETVPDPENKAPRPRGS